MASAYGSHHVPDQFKLRAIQKGNMLKQNVTLGLVAAMLAMPAWSQISVYIGIAPPPIRVEVPPPPPEPSFVWVTGFWAPQGNRYRWVSGHYMRPPYEGAAWYGPHYEQGARGWHYRDGYWGHGRGHAYGHRDGEGDHDRGRGNAYGHDKDRQDDQGHGHGHHHD
jgi:hypothetical protein